MSAKAGYADRGTSLSGCSYFKVASLLSFSRVIMSRDFLLYSQFEIIREIVPHGRNNTIVTMGLLILL